MTYDTGANVVHDMRSIDHHRKAHDRKLKQSTRNGHPLRQMVDKDKVDKFGIMTSLKTNDTLGIDIFQENYGIFLKESTNNKLGLGW